MLEVRTLTAGYGLAEVLGDVSLSVRAGEVVALLGANNAGKTTFINSLSRLVSIFSGSVVFDGQDITAAKPDDVVGLGIVQVPEGRLVFPKMSVRENLLLGGSHPRVRRDRLAQMENAFGLFPILKERAQQLAGTLSGGEQQMLAIARGLMAKPRLLMLDEPSLGLSPRFVQYVFDAIDRLRSMGLTILLVEQNLTMALRYADRCYVMERGRVVVEGDPNAVRDDPRTRTAYLGL
ncbi:MAG TPA: ABC transporter ATP-binding protein [Nitrobacter sp.]|nr:ABC transporter ATP-binding protein [Nitrobacter sp.]